MPVFEIDGGGGRTFEVDAPDMPSAVSAFQSFNGGPQSADNPQADLSIDNVVRSIAQGVPIVGGLADRFSAGMDALTGQLTGRGSVAPDLPTRYAENLAKEQAHTKAFEEANPATAMTANLVGGVGALGAAAKTATGAKLLGLTGQTLPAQITQGAISGAGINAADALTRGQDPIQGAEIGGAIAGAAPVLGRAVGAAVRGVGHIISPLNVPAENAAAVSLLKNEGITSITPGQKSGNRALKYAESHLGDSPGAGGKATALHEQSLRELTAASANKIPEFRGVTDLQPENLNAGIDRIGATFEAVAARNQQMNLDNKFLQVTDKIMKDFEGITGNKPTLIQGFIDRMKPPKMETPARMTAAEFKNFNANKIGPPTISGEQYNTLRSDISALIRKAGNRPEVTHSLVEFQRALDDAVGRNLANPADKEVWRAARQSYLDALILKEALNTTTEAAAKGLITPARLTIANKKFIKDSYTRGRGSFSGLARAANTVMKELPQSGTAPRASAQFIPSMIGGAIGGGVGTVPGVAAAALGPGLLGRLLFSKYMQTYLENQAAAGLRQAPMLGLSNLASIAARGFPTNNP